MKNKKIKEFTDLLETVLPTKSVQEIEAAILGECPEYLKYLEKALSKAKKRLEYKNRQREEMKKMLEESNG